MVEDRIAALEARASTLEARVGELEGPPPPRPETPRVSPPPPPPARPAPTARPAVPPPRDKRPARDIEDLLGGQVLAWVGGIAVLAGLAFLLTIAISRGWIGEGARTALAGALSLGLLAIGVRLRAGRTEAALVATAVGIAGCFGTLQVAGAVYGLVPLAVAELGALATGALAVTLGIRWGAQVLGWLGLIGALLAPPALGALDHGGIVFVALAFAAAVAVIVWQGWTYQAWAAYAIATLDWLAWAGQPQAPGAGTAALVVFGGLTAALAFGLELRGRRLNPTAAVLVGLNALILVGVAVMQEQLRATIAVLAIAHLAVLWMPRISRELRLIAVAIGVVLADIAAPLFLDGLPLVIVWAAPALVFAALVGARRRPEWVDNLVGTAEDRELRPVAWSGRAEPIDWVFAATGMVAQLVLAIAHVISFDAPWTMLSAGADAHALIADAIVGLTVWGAARLSRSGWLDGLALTTLVYMTGQALDSLSLTLALAVEAIALTRFTRIGAMVFAGLATTHALVVLAPPIALVVGLDDPLAAAAGMLAATAAIWFSTRHKGLTALALLYLASVEAVTVGPEHTGQTLLSVLWAVAGVGTLIYGLVKDERETRLAALGLIGVTATKVFLYDLASLDSLYRVASFIAFGLLLLAGAFAYQRVRPRLPLEA